MKRDRKIKELEEDLASKDQVYRQLKGQYKNVQDLVLEKNGTIAGLEQERDEYKNMCEEYEGEINDLGHKIGLVEADLLTMAEVKDEELRKVVDREHAIHNEAAAGMIARIKELEKQVSDRKAVADLDRNTITELEAEHGRRSTLIAHQDQRIAELEDGLARGSEAYERLQKSLDLAASNEQVRMKQLAERELVIIKKEERIKDLEQVNSKLILDLEYNEKLLAQYQEAFQIGDHVHHEDLEVDLAKVLNYWNQDAYLDIPDYLIAKHLIRHLDCIRKMQDETRVWKGGSPPGAETITNARLAHISIDEDGLGTIDVIE